MMASSRWLARGREMVVALRRRHPLHVLAVAAVVLIALLISAVVYGDLPEFLHADVPQYGRAMRAFIGHYTFLGGYVLLYIEESGIPLPAPGDVFVMFVGAHIPHTVWSFVLAWLGLVVAVTLGATNLFLLSRRFGPRLAHSGVADYVHLSPERLEKAEKWFQKYGVLAIIFGRHIPGFRVPITVAAGTLNVPYRIFAPSVAVSTAIWAGVMLTVGVTMGPRLAVLLQAHRQIYFIWAAIVVVMVVSIYLRSRRHRPSEPATRQETKRPVESPSS